LTANNRHAGESRHPGSVPVALLLDSGFRRNDDVMAANRICGQSRREDMVPFGLSLSKPIQTKLEHHHLPTSVYGPLRA